MPTRLLPLLLVAAFVVVGCGGGRHTHAAVPKPPPHAAPGHPCSQADFYMQCAAPAAPSPLTERPSPRSALAYGIDFGWSCPDARSLGAVFGASYLSTDSSKNWTAGCVGSYHSRGVATVAVWETAAGRAADGYTAGRQDALRARAQALALGEPADRPIFFAVDFDTTADPSAVVPYFRGVDSVLGSTRAGDYGGIATVRVLFDRRLVRYGWQTAAWSGGAWDPRAQIQQYSFGAALDWDRAVARDFGQWPYRAPRPVARRYRALCSQLDAITWAKWHLEHGHVSRRQHDRAVADRRALRRGHVGCTARPHSRPYRYPQRKEALA